MPYQFQAGMWGRLNVTSSAAPLLLSENTTNTLQFVPNVLVAMPPSYPASLNVSVTNLGNVPHTFTVARQTNFTVPFTFGPYFSQYPPLGSVNVSATPNSVAWANFSVLAPGVYMYICEQVGHYQAGMYGLLYVGVLPAALPPAPSTAVVETWVLAGSAVLVGIGVILALAAAFTGRFPVPPESTAATPDRVRSLGTPTRPGPVHARLAYLPGRSVGSVPR